MTTVSTILVVDDEASARDTLEALLFKEGYELIFAENGSQALQKAKEMPPDLVLLDVMMPHMDGFEVCQRLREDPVLNDVPVIMVTALDDTESRLKGITAGADDFVSKPYDRTELRARIRTIIRLNRYHKLYMEHARFEWIVQNANDGYLMLNDANEIVYANLNACSYLNLPVNGLSSIPGTFLEWIKKQYHCEPQWAWECLLNPSKQPAVEFPLLYLVRPETTESRAFWLQVRIMALSIGNTSSMVLLRDVTAEVSAQRDIRSFQGLISHKLRTPFTAILGNLRLLADRKMEMTRDEIAEFSTMILENAEGFYSDIDDILAYLDAPGLARPGERFSISQIQSTLERFADGLGIKSISVSCPDELNSYSIALSQRAVDLILREILKNAVKFHPAHSPSMAINISWAGNQKITIQIGDDGLNLSPEQFMHIWSPYYQGERYFTGRIDGVGLGLAMVAGLIYEVGGTCNAHNQPQGTGIVIELTIPVCGNNDNE